MSKLLISAFEPFNGRKVNSSEKVLKKLSENYSFESVILPVAYDTAANTLIKKIKKYKPKFILMIGESSKVNQITIELTGKNLDNATIVDNNNSLRIKAPIDNNGPNKIKKYANEYKINKKLKKNIKFSNNAGGFVCNNTLYLISKFLLKDKSTNYCFIHIPTDARKTNTYSKIIEEFIKLNL